MNLEQIKSLIASRTIQYGSEYSVDGKKGYSNHYPMNIYALYQLGANETQLENFDRHNIKKLTPKAPVMTKIDKNNWKNFLGQRTHNQEYYDFFLSEIDKIGTRKTILKYLSHLSNGVSAYAFHGLIRLAFAIEMDLKEEYAEALTNWAMGYQTLDISLPKKDLSIEECIQRAF